MIAPAETNEDVGILSDQAISSVRHKAQGDAFLAQGKLDEAAASYHQAVVGDAQCVDAYLNLGFVLSEQRHYAAAERALRQALKITPALADAFYILGTMAKAQGNSAGVIENFSYALELRPDFEIIYGDLCQLLYLNGQTGRAREVMQKAIEQYSANVDFHVHLGKLYVAEGETDRAVECFLKALSIAPGCAQAHNLLGLVFQSQGKLDEAISSYQAALLFKPDFAEAQNNQGNVHQLLGRLESAISCYQKALSVQPKNADAYNNLGAALQAQSRFDEAVECYQQALVLKPDFAEAYSNLGSLFKDLGRFDDAALSYRRALQIAPEFLVVRSNLLFICHYLAHQSTATLFLDARRYGDLVARRAHCYTTWHNSPVRGRCLRVGFVSGDFCAHPVGYFIEGVLAALARELPGQLELIAYPNHVFSDEVTLRIKACCHGWHSVIGLSDKRLAQRISEDGIDILIDLSGHTDNNRLPLFAWKPAPVQVSWLGYFASTGIGAIDYLIADPWTLPESEKLHFTEKIWRLPETRLCFTVPDVPVEVSTLPALGNGYLTFGCFNNLTKMNDSVVALWSRVLRAVPHSRLFLKSKQLKEVSVRQKIAERFAAHGIGAERLIFEGAVPRAEYLSSYHRVDIALDPFPYPGGTTTAESLWMGVPVLSLVGESFLSRQGFGLLMNAGLPEWIAMTPDDYVTRAVSHASDLRRLAALRSGLRQQVLASPIFDTRRFARHFESALRGMWEKWCDQQTGADA